MADRKPWSSFKSKIYSFFNRKPATNTAIVELARIESGHRVLDIGCGPGIAVQKAAALVGPGAAVGVDRSPSMVEIARKRAAGVRQAAFEVGSAEKLPFSDDSFDVVWTVSAFHHWEDKAKGIAEARRVLRPGGRLLILEKETRGKHGLNRENARMLKSRLERVGYRDVSVESHDKSIVVEAQVDGSADSASGSI